MTMDAYECLKVLDEIAGTSARSGKEEWLDRYLDDPFFRRVVTAALDPYTRFGIGVMPEIAENGNRRLTEDSSAWFILDAMASGDLRGGKAEDALIDLLTDHDEPSAEIIKRMILKDLRAGMGVKTVNKVRKNLVPVFACQLAHKFEEKRCKTWPMTVEPKLDGVRCLAIATAGDVEFVSRTGRAFTSFDHLKEPLMDAIKAWEKVSGRFGGVVLDGEVVSGSFNKTVSEVRKKETAAKDAKFFAFDVLPLEDFKVADLIDVPFKDRRDTLRKFLKHFDKEAPFKLLPSYLVNSVEEIHLYNAKFRSKKLEGTIVKDRDAPYKKSRSHGWLKIKGEETIDVRVTGVFEGTGKYEGQLGGLVVDVDGVDVRVGGGFSDGQRVDFWNDQGSVVGRLIEVEYHEKTPDGSLRHPRFIRFRDDKDEELAA